MTDRDLDYTIRVRFQRPRTRPWRERLLSFTPWVAVEWYDQPAAEIVEDFAALAKWYARLREEGEAVPRLSDSA